MPQNKYCIKNILNSNLKDHIQPEKKSGIYQINCKDCKKIYIYRKDKKRFGNQSKNGEIEKSTVSAHVQKEKHTMDCKPVLLKQASNKQELTNWENILIIKYNDHIINF